MLFFVIKVHHSLPQLGPKLIIDTFANKSFELLPFEFELPLKLLKPIGMIGIQGNILHKMLTLKILFLMIILRLEILLNLQFIILLMFLLNTNFILIVLLLFLQ